MFKAMTFEYQNNAQNKLYVAAVFESENNTFYIATGTNRSHIKWERLTAKKTVISPPKKPLIGYSTMAEALAVAREERSRLKDLFS